MAAIDKTNEFYTCLRRFVFLATCYRPEDTPEEVCKALDCIVEYYKDNIFVQKRAEEAEDFFQEASRYNRRHLLNEVARFLVTEMAEIE